MTQLPTLGQTFQKEVTVKIKKTKATVANIDVPILDEVFEGYFSNRVDIMLTQDHRNTLKAVMYGLQSRFEKLQNGKEVANAGDTVKWLIERISGKTDIPKAD